MSLPTASSERKLMHRRSIDLQVFARGDGLWEVDAHLEDTKTRDIVLADGVRPAGQAVHDMVLRLVVDDQLNVIAAGSASLATPYPGHCDAHHDAYARLVGLNLMRGFHRAVKERLGGVQACTHLTELSQVLPTAVVQAFAGVVIDTHQGRGDDEPPFQLDRCHALRRDGAAVKTHYPRWYRSASSATALARSGTGEANPL